MPKDMSRAAALGALLPMLLMMPATVPAAAAEIKSCAAVAKAPSGTAPGAASVTVANDSGTTVRLVWHGYDGSPAEYGQVAAGQSVAQQSYETQIWELDGASGCICAFVLAPGEQAVTIAADGQCVAGPGAKEAAYEPTGNYLFQNEAGWTVLVSPRYDQAVGQAVLMKLYGELSRVRDVLPPKALAVVQKVPVWLEVDDPQMPAPGVYESSEKWLADNGENPDKAGAVRFTQDLVTATEQQPMIVLHQLALAYMDRQLGFNDPELVAAFKAAGASGRYENVDRLAGGKGKAEALVNQAEYFAELSEAYFGQNDFFPFTRDDLRSFDPAGYRLVEEAWTR